MTDKELDENVGDPGVFVYKAAIDGVEHALTFKPLDEIPTGILRTARGDPEAQLWLPFEWALSPDDLAILDMLPAKTLPKILEAWQQHSEIELGELTASSPSSTTAAVGKRSRRTSSRSG